MRFVLSRCRVLLMVAGLWIMAAPAAAVPITYQESVSGDLAGFVGPTAMLPLLILPFDIGTNTVSGTLGLDDADSFAFTIPAGATLVSGGVSLVDVVNDQHQAGWDFRTGSVPNTGSLLQTLVLSSPGTLALVAPQPGGTTYHLFNFLLSGAINPASTADFTFTFDVRPTQVPAPATWSLLGIGLAVLGGRKWLQRRHA